jgi:hypothetical protein
MSPAELVWRARTGVRVRLLDGREAAGPAARFDDPGWRATVLELAQRERDAVLRAAERIAAGELSLWGRRVEVDPEQPDWSSDPLTGVAWTDGAWRGAGRDPKPIWELHRQQHLVPLAAGAALTGRADWGRLAVAQALDWTERHPPTAGIVWASGYEAAHRLVTWAFALPLVAEHANEAELDRLGAAVADHRAFVAARPSRYSSANNHRLAELAGLLAGSHLTPGRPDWDDLWTELEREAVRQTYADGGSREQAAGSWPPRERTASRRPWATTPRTGCSGSTTSSRDGPRASRTGRRRCSASRLPSRPRRRRSSPRAAMPSCGRKRRGSSST